MKTNNSHAYIQELTKDITPALRYDAQEDFDLWHTRARQKLTELLGLPLQRCEDEMAILRETDCDGFRRIDFEFQTEPGYFASAALLIPDGTEAPRPTAICLQGHSHGMHISFGEVRYPGDEKTIAGGRDFAVRAVKEGFCAVTLEQRYMGLAGHTEDGSPACLRNNEGMATLLLGRTAIGERVWDVQRLIDVIYKYFTAYVDTEKLVCLGNSGGGTATFYSACMEDRIRLAVPSCAVCTYEDSIMAMNHCPCNFIPGIRRWFDMGDLGGLIAPRKFILVCGKEDPIFPLPGVEKSYELISGVYRHLGKEQDCALVRGEGGHRFYPDEAWPVIHAMLGA